MYAIFGLAIVSRKDTLSYLDAPNYFGGLSSSNNNWIIDLTTSLSTIDAFWETRKDLSSFPGWKQFHAMIIVWERIMSYQKAISSSSFKKKKHLGFRIIHINSLENVWLPCIWLKCIKWVILEKMYQ